MHTRDREAYTSQRTVVYPTISVSSYSARRQKSIQWKQGHGLCIYYILFNLGSSHWFYYFTPFDEPAMVNTYLT